jgi:hypothetical protein
MREGIASRDKQRGVDGAAAFVEPADWLRVGVL